MCILSYFHQPSMDVFKAGFIGDIVQQQQSWKYDLEFWLWKFGMVVGVWMVVVMWIEFDGISGEMVFFFAGGTWWTPYWQFEQKNFCGFAC